MPPQPDHVTAKSFRMLGHVVLCGALYITWQRAPNAVHGEYLACMLFRSMLLLSTVQRGTARYVLRASIALAEAHIEDCDKGEGKHDSRKRP